MSYIFLNFLTHFPTIFKKSLSCSVLYTHIFFLLIIVYVGEDEGYISLAFQLFYHMMAHFLLSKQRVRLLLIKRYFVT